MIVDTHKAIERIDDRVATKSDIREVQLDIKIVLSEMGALRSEISTIKWMVGIFGASSIMMIGFILTKL